MGAWGSGVFENDAAMEWLATAVDDPTAIDSAFEATCEVEYLDVDEGAVAVAAAAIVAAAVDGDVSELPEDAQAMIEGVTANAKLRARAVKALNRVLGPDSELVSLWEEGEDKNSFRKRMELLRGRLESPRKSASSRGTSASIKKPTRRKRIEAEQGDIFEVPLEDGRRGYGQVLTFGAARVGFFELSSVERLPLEKIIASPVAFRIGCLSETIIRGDWPILGNVPLTPAMREPLRMYRNNGPDWWFLYEWTPETGGHERRVPRDEVRGLETSGLWQTRDAVKRLEMHLRGEPCPWVEIAE